MLEHQHKDRIDEIRRHAVPKEPLSTTLARWAVYLIAGWILLSLAT